MNLHPKSLPPPLLDKDHFFPISYFDDSGFVYKSWLKLPVPCRTRYHLMPPICNNIYYRNGSPFSPMPDSCIISSLRLCIQSPLHFLKLKNYLSLFQTQLKHLKDFCYIDFSCMGAVTGRPNTTRFFKLYLSSAVHISKTRMAFE